LVLRLLLSLVRLLVALLVALLVDRLGGRLGADLGERGVEPGELVLLGRLLLDAGRRGVTGVLLPVTGALQDRSDGGGRLGTDAQPVLGTLRVDLDDRRIVLGVVLPDLLD